MFMVWFETAWTVKPTRTDPQSWFQTGWINPLGNPLNLLESTGDLHDGQLDDNGKQLMWVG
jgi:hypothetical protein